MDDPAKTQAREWIEDVTGEKFHKDKTFAEELQNGVRLIKLIRKIDKGLIDTKHAHLHADPDASPYKCMENISLFLKAARKIGVPEHDLFPTIALFERKDISKVVVAVHAVGRYAQKNVPEFDGPHLGSKLATPNKRFFTRDQKDEAYRAVSLLNMGSTMTMDRATQGMQSSRLNLTDNRLNKGFGVKNTKVENPNVVHERVKKTTQKHYESVRDKKETDFEDADENNRVPVTVRGSKWGSTGKQSQRQVVSFAQKDDNGEHFVNTADAEEKLGKDELAPKPRKKSRKKSHRKKSRPSTTNSAYSSDNRGKDSIYSSTFSQSSDDFDMPDIPNMSEFSNAGNSNFGSGAIGSMLRDNDLDKFVFVKLRQVDTELIEEAGHLIDALCSDLYNYRFGVDSKNGKNAIKKILKCGGGVGVVREKPDNVCVGIIAWKPEASTLHKGIGTKMFDMLKIRKQEYLGAIKTIHEKNAEKVSGAWEVLLCGVLPDYRCKGIGRKLVNHVANMADKVESACIIDVSSEAAKAWAIKSGFKNLGRINIKSHGYGSYLLIHEVMKGA